MPTDTPALTIARLARLLATNAPPDLTLGQFRLLGLLSVGDERSTSLAERMAVAKPTVTSLVDTLVERGLVARETAPDDRRVVRVAITTTGRDAFRAASAHFATLLDDVVGRCDDPDAVLGAFDQLRQALDARWAAIAADKAASR